MISRSSDRPRRHILAESAAPGPLRITGPPRMLLLEDGSRFGPRSGRPPCEFMNR